MRERYRYLVFLILMTPICAFASEHAEGGEGVSITHRMMLVAIQLGLLLFATRLGNILFERWKLPGVLGELFAGMVIGPALLGGLALPGFPSGLFPPGEGFAVSAELYAFCAVASIILLFMVGLETDIQQFLKYSVAGSAVGIGGVVASFIAGDLITVAFGRFLFGQSVSFMDPQCLFLGVVSTATSVGITARILTEKRKLDSPEGVTILAGAVVDDVLGIIMLTLALGIVTASKASGKVDWGHIGVIGVKAVGIWLVATAAGLLFSRHIGTLLKRFRGQSSIAVMALGMALILAGLFEEAGLAMIIGAYIMGLSLSRTDLAHMIRERLTPVYVFLVPIFFGVMGMLVDFGALGNSRVLLFGLVYSVVAVIAKVVGSGAVGLLFNFNVLGASRVGVGMVPRGEVALIVAGIGLAAGALTPDVFGVAILMTVVTTVAAPPILVKLFGSQHSGLRRQVEEGTQESVRFSFPSTTISRWVLDKLEETFQREGFFVHSLEHEREIVQVRRDVDVINMWPEDTDIVFSCKAGELPLVKTAVYEVLAELKGTIQMLREPVDVATVVGDLHVKEATRKEEGATSVFMRSLSHQVVSPSLIATDKEQIIVEMLDLLCGTGLVKDRQRALDDVLQRERSMSTGLQRGIAIPHARTSAVDRLVCAVGLKPDGADFGAMDGQPSTIFVMTLSPESAATPHLQFMSEVSQILTPERCEELLRCGTAVEVLSVLSGGEPSAQQSGRRQTLTPVTTRNGGAGAFRLSDYLDPRLIVHDLDGNAKTDVISELLDRISDQVDLGDTVHVRQELLRREKLMSTGLERGVAVPHCRTDTVGRLTCAIGLKPEGVNFDSLDGKPAHIIALTLTPLSNPAPYVQFITSFVLALDKAGMTQILGTTNAQEVWDLLCAANG